MTKRPRGQSRRQYPRTARLNQLLREILAEELELIDDDRLGLLTVIEVDVDAELSRAILYYMVHDDDRADEAQASLDDHRIRLQGAVGRQARIKRVPELVFRLDEVTEQAARIEQILRELPETAPDESAPDESGPDEPDPS